MKGKPTVELLIANFERCLSYYEANPPFTRPEQIRTHRVIGRRTGKPSRSKIVGGSKTLHHVLPELMPPIDRTYTGFFLSRDQSQHFQNAPQEAETFRLAFESFCAIASSVSPPPLTSGILKEGFAT